MADFKINITADATKAVAEAKSTQEALKQVGSAATAAGNEGSRAASNAAKGNKELKQVIQQLTREFPVLGAAARLVVHPVVAAATIGATAFTFFRDQITKFEAGLSDTQWGSYAKKAGLAAEQVREVASAAKEAEQASARLMDVFNAQQSAEQKLAEARKRVEVAKANGEQDPVKRAQKLLEIENRYAAEELQRDERGRNFKITQQEERAKKLREDAARMGAEEKKWVDISKRVGSPEEAKKELEEWKKRRDETTKERIKQEETFDEMYGGGWKRFKYEMIPGYGDQMWSAMEQRDQLRAQEAYFDKIIADREQQLGIATKADERVGALRANRQEATASAGGIEAMLPTQRAVAGIESGAARGAFELNAQAAAQNAANEMTQNLQRLLNDLVGAMRGGNKLTADLIRRVQEAEAARRDLEMQVKNRR
jgi:hypothetical protein